MMRTIKNLLIFFFAVTLISSCSGDDEVSFALQDVSAPSKLKALFDISTNDTGEVSVTPTGEGASIFEVFFGDVENETPTEVNPGETLTHIYGEGEFTLRIVGIGATGLTSELNRIVTMSFVPPTDLAATITVVNDFDVTVTPTAMNASVFDIYFGVSTDETPITIMAGETATNTYSEEGNYTIRVVAKGASATTISYEEVVSIVDPSSSSAADFIGTWTLAAEAGAFGVGPALGDLSFFSLDAQGILDRACFVDDMYVFGADGSFNNVLGADTWVEAWQGGSDACGTPIAPHDGSAAATYTYDNEAGTLTITGTGAYIALSKGTNNGELTSPANAPNAITYKVSLSQDKNTMNVNLETSPGVFWQFKLLKEITSPLEGTWKVAAEAGSFGIGPSIGNVEWFSLDAQGIIDRACLIDDEYSFGADGSYTMDLGTETWIEVWQGGTEACGAPVAPHDGSATATYVYDETAGTLTLNGTGAYIALSKGTNTGELTSPMDAPASLVYQVSFVDANTMNVSIETGTGSGNFWQFKLVKE